MAEQKQAKQADLTALVIQLPNGRVAVHLQIQCPDCGMQGLTFAAHHLRGLRDVLIDLIDQFPAESGMEAPTEITRRGWGGGPKGDPTLN